MLVRISRIVLLLLIVFVASIVLPKYYWRIFEKSVSPPLVYYSSIKKDFVYFERINKKNHRYDNAGNEITRAQFEKLTPLQNFRTLVYKGIMPDSLNGAALDYHELQLNNLFIKVKPDDIAVPVIPLFPLFESKPDGPQLSLPEEFSRITDRFEFINCSDNEINAAETEKFTSALSAHGFAFPAKKFFGNPSTRKAFDEGYFVVDSNEKLFHIKKIKGEPYCREVPLPSGEKIAFIKVYENELREFYGLLITESNNLYFISYDNYRLIKLPSKNYDFRKTTVRIMTNIFYRIISIIGDNRIDVYVTDRKYNTVNKFTKTWKNRYESSAGSVFKYIFPFSLSLADDNSSYIDFYLRWNGWSSVYFILLSIIAVFFIHRHRKDIIKDNLCDYIIVLFAGIFGLLGVLLIRREYNS